MASSTTAPRRSHPHRRYGAACAVLAAVALAVPAVAACDPDKALDCARLAVEISNDVDDLQDAVTGAALDPDEADKILDTLDRDIDKLDDRTDNADVGKALDDLQKAVNNVRTSVDRDQHPDLSPVTDALGELTKVCAPG